MEKLAQWLKVNGVRRNALAAHIGTVPSTITDAIKGRQRLSLVMAVKIELATGGKVRAIDLADPAEVGKIERLK